MMGHWISKIVWKRWEVVSLSIYIYIYYFYIYKIYIYIYIFFVFSCTRDWVQGLVLARQVLHMFICFEVGPQWISWWYWCEMWKTEESKKTLRFFLPEHVEVRQSCFWSKRRYCGRLRIRSSTSDILNFSYSLENQTVKTKIVLSILIWITYSNSFVLIIYSFLYNMNDNFLMQELQEMSL
jgi:hypothetical protein